MTLAILYSIPPQDLNAWWWMASGGFERTEFAYFRLVQGIYEGFRQTTGSFSAILLMRDKYQNQSNCFLILREISNVTCLCKLHIRVWCASFQEYLIAGQVYFTLAWEDTEIIFIGLYWKTSNSVSCGVHTAQIPVDFSPLPSSSSSLFPLLRFQ